MTPSQEKLREEIARIIDPHGWATRDRQTRLLSRMEARGEATPPGAYDSANYYARDSLAKADAILALPNPPPEPTADPSRPREQGR